MTPKGVKYIVPFEVDRLRAQGAEEPRPHQRGNIERFNRRLGPFSLLSRHLGRVRLDRLYSPNLSRHHSDSTSFFNSLTRLRKR